MCSLQCNGFFLKFYLTQNVVEGAQTTIHLAVSEEVEDVTGEYFADCQVRIRKSIVISNIL